MKLLIVSGISGSGKSIALNTLEDLDYYCIDNLPVGMLKAFTDQMAGEWGRDRERFAVGIDARNSASDLQHFPSLLGDLRQSADLDCTLFFLQADDATLLKRFSETRRRHPLTRDRVSLADAIQLERELLEPIAANADLQIDTTHTTIHQLRDLVHERVRSSAPEAMSILFESFGYKHGVPSDADFVFDARCLPNPHWEPSLQSLTGRDEAVLRYLESNDHVIRMVDHLRAFLDAWIPCFERENRSYMTVAIGCTGGQHRSVYLAETLAEYFRSRYTNVLVRHRELI